jgi:hypothetical protein
MYSMHINHSHHALNEAFSHSAKLKVQSEKLKVIVRPALAGYFSFEL